MRDVFNSNGHKEQQGKKLRHSLNRLLIRAPYGVGLATQLPSVPVVVHAWVVTITPRNASGVTFAVLPSLLLVCSALPPCSLVVFRIP